MTTTKDYLSKQDYILPYPPLAFSLILTLEGARMKLVETKQDIPEKISLFP